MRPIACALLGGALVCFASNARGEDPEPDGVAPVASDEEYRTPLAGKPFVTDFLGEHVDLPVRDRGQTFAITIGSSFFEPPIGSQRVVPFAALYYNLTRNERRLRTTIAALV